MPVVKFIRNAPPYAAGELAGFDAATCRKLIAQGAAVHIEPEIIRPEIDARPDNADPGSQISGATADGKTLPPAFNKHQRRSKRGR